MPRLAVFAGADQLTVRNNWTTRVLARRDIEGFRVGSTTRSPIGSGIHVLLRNIAVLALDATTLTLPLPGNRARLQDRLDRLTRWHSSQQIEHGGD